MRSRIIKRQGDVAQYLKGTSRMASIQDVDEIKFDWFGNITEKTTREINLKFCSQVARVESTRN